MTKDLRIKRLLHAIKTLGQCEYLTEEQLTLLETVVKEVETGIASDLKKLL